MKPYYQEDGITIYHGDCREVLECLDLEFDCCVTSPPYNQQISEFSESGIHRETSWISKISAGYSDSMGEDDYQSWQVNVLERMSLHMAEFGSIFYNHKIRWRDGVLIHPVVWVTPKNLRLRQEIIWARNGTVTMNARMFGPSDERILWFTGKQHKWNQECMAHMSVWKIDQYGTFGAARDGIADHPCAYPVEIPKRCINATTDPGDLVFDPFMGSGTTLRAAKDLGRWGIGIEIEGKYCEIAAKRLAQKVFDFQPAGEANDRS